MAVFTLRTIYLFLYLFIASQGMFYLIALAKALRTISIATFLEQRRAVDAVIGDPLRLLYFSAIGTALAALVLTVKHPKSIVFITILLSFFCLTADLYLAVSKSIPLNKIINHYPSNSFGNIEAVRTEWIDVITCRGILSIMGLVLLLIGFLIESYKQHFSIIE